MTVLIIAVAIVMLPMMMAPMVVVVMVVVAPRGRAAVVDRVAAASVVPPISIVLSGPTPVVAVATVVALVFVSIAAAHLLLSPCAMVGAICWCERWRIAGSAGERNAGTTISFSMAVGAVATPRSLARNLCCNVIYERLPHPVEECLEQQLSLTGDLVLLLLAQLSEMQLIA